MSYSNETPENQNRLRNRCEAVVSNPFGGTIQCGRLADIKTDPRRCPKCIEREMVESGSARTHCDDCGVAVGPSASAQLDCGCMATDDVERAATEAAMDAVLDSESWTAAPSVVRK